MPLTEKGKTILSEMVKKYGKKKGTKIFYASKNKGTITGVDEQTVLHDINEANRKFWSGKRY